MTLQEFTFGIAVVIVLVGLAGYFTWRQVRTLRQLAGRTDLSDEDRGYYRGQARRRLVGSVMMLILAGLLIGSYFLDQEFRQVTEGRPAPGAPIQPEEREFLQRFTTYWIVALGVLFLFGLFAMFDILATLKYGVRQHRKLRDQHRADLEAEVRRLRQQRNGEHRR